ncbi:MAG TPA: hypothetical protein VGM78_07245, partial [Ilumatobacteraceae bacterium]
IIVALVTCVVIAGRPRVLAWAPLVLIGTFSYGLYLWHPLAAVITPNVIVRVVLTAAFAVTSYYVIERPLRTTVRKPRALFLVACTSVVALLFAVFMPVQSTPLRFAAVAPVVAAAPELPTTTTTAPVATTTTTTIATNTSPPAADGSVPATTDPPATTAPTTTTAAAPRTLRISGVGDSTQMFLDGALESWAATYPQDITWVKPPDAIVPWTSGADNWIRDFAPGAGLSLPTDGPQGGLDRQGCPLIYDVPIRPNSQWGYFDSSTLHSSTPIASCDWHNWVPQALAEMHVDVLVASWAVTAMWDYKLPNGSRGRVGVPAFDKLLAQEMADFEAMAASYGTRVLWLTYQPLPQQAHPDFWSTPPAADAFAVTALAQPCSHDLRPLIRNDKHFDWYQDGYHFTPAGAARAVADMSQSLLACSAQPLPTGLATSDSVPSTPASPSTTTTTSPSSTEARRTWTRSALM